MSRAAILTTCNRCHAPIVTGIDDYRIQARADLVPLTRHGEIQAAIAGRDTWRIDADRRLWRTDRWRIHTDAPMPGDHRLTSHLCGQPIPADWVEAVQPVLILDTDPNGEPAW